MQPYQVIARKYRPLRFQDIVGQQHIVRALKNSLKNQRWGHSFLFSGPRGVGKTTTARILAKALNCEQGPAEEPCNECEICQEITLGNSLDVFEIDGASNNSVDDIRDIREKVRYGASRARFKIYIIDEVHMLSTSAFNALLKTLEEPPSHVVFIFATTEVHKIPITIISRCQHFEFTLLSVQEIIDSCKNILNVEGLEYSDESLRMIARAAEGSLRDSQSILEQVINVADGKIDIEAVKLALGTADPETLYSLVWAVGNGELGKVMSQLDHIATSGYDLYQLGKDIIQLFRSLLLVKILKKPQEILDVTKDELDELKKIAKDFDFDRLEKGLLLLVERENDLRHTSNPRFVLEALLSRISRFEDLIPLRTILKKIDAIPLDNVVFKADVPVENAKKSQIVSHIEEKKPGSHIIDESHDTEKKSPPAQQQRERHSSGYTSPQEKESAATVKAVAQHSTVEPPSVSSTDSATSEAESGDYPSANIVPDVPSADEKQEAQRSEPSLIDESGERESLFEHFKKRLQNNQTKTSSAERTVSSEAKLSQQELPPDDKSDEKDDVLPLGPSPAKAASQQKESVSAVVAQQSPVATPTEEKKAVGKQVREVLSAESGNEPLDLFQATSIWKKTVHIIAEQKKSLGTLLENSHVVSFKNGVVRIAPYNDKKLDRRMLEEQKNLDLLKRALKQVTGTVFNVEIVAWNNQKSYSIREESEAAKNAAFDEQVRLLRADPIIAYTLDTFKARILKIENKDTPPKKEE